MNKIYKYIILLIFITSIKGVAQNQITLEKEQWIEDIDFIIKKAEGFLSTDIKDVYLEYYTSENGELKSLVMNWKGTILKLK